MSLLPYDDGDIESRELVVRKTEISPSNTADPPGAFTRMLNKIRLFIGMKPLYLAERFCEAKVKLEENKADATKLAAVGEYQKIMAEVRRMDAETDAMHAKQIAEAEALRAETRHKDNVNQLAEKLFLAKGLSPENALAQVEDVVRRIEMLGGSVEFDLREFPPSDEDDDGPKGPTIPVFL